MRALALPIACLLAALVARSGGAAPAPAALSCGVPETRPVWIDFADGSVSFWRERFAQPGIVVATGTVALAASLRAAGAATVDWDMHLEQRVGTPSAPADAGLMDDRADTLFEYAKSVTGCANPLITLNELQGARVPTPWTPTTERYRANVLEFVRRLSERGARPALLVAGEPNTGGDAAAWWQAVGSVSDIVLEKYWNANVISRAGPIAGSRRLRASYRARVVKLLAVGVPASRLGVMVGFQTRIGYGGREGLQPSERWFEVVKLEAFAARQVARELQLAHVWSWGWATHNDAARDPDKPFAACAWLWARDPTLCDAPRVLGPGFDADRHEGQIDLARGLRCVLGSTVFRKSAVAEVGRLTHDSELALTALVVRAIESEVTEVAHAQVLTAERAIVSSRFGGNRSAYSAALAEVGASRDVARGIIEEELRRSQIEQGLTAPRPTPADVERFRVTYGPVLTRMVEVSPEPSWLPAGRGLVLATSAPHAVFRIAAGRKALVRTPEGRFTVRPLTPPMPLAAAPPALARQAIMRELGFQLRDEAFASWSIRKQNQAQSRLVCERDRLPAIGVVTLASFAPFLSLEDAVPDTSSAFARP